jgi:glutathione S-transferase
MKILNDATSPFGRKTIVAAIERGVSVEEVFVDLHGTTLDQWNPLRQIPTLLPRSGPAIYDSDVIVLFLDRQHGGVPLVPEQDATAVLTRMSLANGLMEATLMRLLEKRREVSERSEAMIEKMEARIWRVLKALNGNLEFLTYPKKDLQADQIATAVALKYVSFRFSESWLDKYPALGAWCADMSSRRSMILTAPTRTAPVPRDEFTRGL